MSKRKSLSVKNIDDINDVTSACQKVIANSLNNRNLSFQTERLGRGKFRSMLTGAESSPATVGGRTYPVFLLEQINEELFWIGVVLLFGFSGGKQYLESVSLVVTKGLAFDNKMPILRAEWDCGDEYLSAPHGQPHWHIYPSAIINRHLDSDDVLEVLTNPDQDYSELTHNIKLPYFHFAMATKWHEDGETTHASLDDVLELLDWIKGCIHYTRGQLLYAWE